MLQWVSAAFVLEMPLKSVFVVRLQAHTHTHRNSLHAVNKVCKVVAAGEGKCGRKCGWSDHADLKNKLVALTQQD